MLSKHVEIKNSNEVDVVVAILKALCIFRNSFKRSLMVQSDSFNAIMSLRCNLCLDLYFGCLFSISIDMAMIWKII